MVFESIATDLINRFLGDYVENLDKNQLKIGIWGGDVVLNNLALRQNALDDLDLPVQIVYGHLGKLVLKIPWKNLYSEPVVAQIEDLYVLVSPNQSVKYDAEKEAKYDLQAKQSELQKIDDARKQELEKNKPKADKSFTEKLTAQIVNNLQIKIANVHIRYEDKATTDNPFAIGITLHGLDFFTTDANWTKSYMTEQLSKVFKVANLDSLSAYMNCKTMMFTKQDAKEYPRLFKETIGVKDTLPADYRYILGPITSMAKLQLNMNPEYDEPPFVIPKIDLVLEMEKLNVGITRTQFQDVLKLGDSMNRMKLGAPYRQYRPFGIGYRGHYKEWWHFAITCVLETDVRRRAREWSWEHMKQHRKLIQTYAEAYKEKLLAKKPAATLLETCNLCEQKLDLFNLSLVRNRVHLEVDKLRKEEEKKQATQKSSWFGWWGGSKQDDANENKDDIVKQFEAAMTSDEKAKLYRAIGYQENVVQATLPEAYVAVKMNFKLGGLEIGVRDDTSSNSTNSFAEMQQILSLKLSVVTCDLCQRPAANAIKADISMKELTVSGYKRDNFTPTLVESQVPDHNTLLDIHFETNPLDRRCDQRVKLFARPLLIVYDAETIIQLAKVFTTPKTVNLSQLEGAAADRLENIKERSATGIQYMVEKHERLEVDIQCMPNIVILPFGGMYISGYTSVIVVSLGQLNISTIPRPTEIKDVQAMHESGSNKEQILQAMMNQSYDKFKINIADIQILVAKPKERWMDALTEGAQSEMHVLRPTSLILTADICVIDDDPRLPKTKIGILLPSIGINVTEERVLDALSLITSIPFPEGDKIETMPLNKASSLVTSSVSLLKFLDSEKEKMAKKAAAKPETSAEIVQYTQLEVTFALNELAVAIYKVRDEKETPSDQYKTPTEEFAAITLDDSTSSFVGASEHEKIISFKVMQLEANVAQRTYEMVVSVKLGAVQLNQYDKWDGEETVLTIIDTPRFTEEMTYLLTISYVNANKISPEFMTKYNSTEQFVQVDFSTLVMTLHQECIKELLQIANSFQKRIEEINSNNSNEPKDRFASAAEPESILTAIKSNLETIEEEPGAIKKSKSFKKGKVVDSIKVKVVANLEQVAVELTCRKRPIASLKVQNLHAGVIMKSSYTELTLKLKDILVTDLNPLSIHSTILSIIGENALYCQIVMFNLDETSNYNSDDLKIDVSMGCVKIVFLNWFVTSVLTFLGNFQAAQQAIADASVAAADAAKQNVVDAYEKATRMKLNIKIKAPLIIVPVDSQSLRAISLDLGFLSITNTCSEIAVAEDNRSPAVIDEMKLELKEMKLSKANIINMNDSSSGRDSGGSVSDLVYGLKSNVNILDPISFNLVVLRNLSAGWYKEKPELDVSGRLKSIEVNLLVEDYVLLMSILSKNLSEGQDEFPSAMPPVPVKLDKPESDDTAVTNIEVHRESGDNYDAKKIVKKVEPKSVSTSQQVGDKKKIGVQLKFNFQIDGVVANLITADNEGLASFGLYFLSLKGQKLVDGTLSTSIVLCDIQLDDIRSSNESKIKKYLQRKENKSKELKGECGQVSSMLDIVANIKDNDTFAEIRICGFDLIISIDFLLKIAEFFKLPEDESPPESSESKTVDTKAVAAVSKTPVQAKKTAQTESNSDKQLHVILHLEEPDIILVENMDDINTHAIIFNSEISLNLRMFGEKQMINGEIKELKMYMCSFQPDRREATKHYIIHPCTLSLQGSTPEDRGLNISVKLSEIVINISPATIELVNKAIVTLNSNGDKNTAITENHNDYSDIWGVKELKEEDFWFFKIDEACEAIDLEEVVEAKPETCIIEIPSILLVIETGVGYYTTPMLFIETRMNATVNDWSKNLNVNACLNLCMSYYNSALAVWEPLIEQNERKLPSGLVEYGPWELNFDLRLDSKKNDESESDGEAMTKIIVHSRDILELTLSKTCFEVLQMLGQAFSQAFDAGGLVKPDVIAPYVIENDTGFDIFVDFTKGPFTLNECHMPTTSVNFNESINRSVVFQTDDSNIQIAPTDVKSCKISPGGRVYLQTKFPRNKSVVSSVSVLSANIPDSEEVLYVQIGDITKEIALPVHKSDQRYFPLYRDTNKEPWGIISDVRSEYGTTKINIHGVVKIKNHFTNTISVYRMRNEKPFLVGEVAPGTEFNVPLHAIYAPIKDLFFSLPGYKCSIQGINWKDSPTDLQFARNLQCDPVSTFEPLYITAIREKVEVFHEVTSKFTLMSACFTIHLRPPLYLCNALPIEMIVSVAGCSVSQDGVPKGVEVVEQVSKSAVKEDFLDYGEKVVKPGDVLHLPTVKLTTRGGEAKSYIVARLVQYLEKDWSCTTEISENHEDFAVWTFASYDSVEKMEIELGVRFENRHGSLMVTIYCPFWMINKTGLMLSYRKSRKTEKNELAGAPSKANDESINVLYHPPEYEGPILFSFREKSFFGKKRASIRVDSGEWSEKIPLDVAGSEGVVQCKANDMTYQIAVHNHLTQNSLTKQITFLPFYILINKAYFAIEVQEETRSADPWTKIAPNECVPLWPKADTNHMLRVKALDHRHISRPFKYTDVQCTLLMMKNQYGGINVDVQVTEGGIYITFSEYHDGDAPGLVINHTNRTISFWEKGNVNKRTLNPSQKMLYAWADPAGDKVILWDAGKNQIENDLRRDGVDEFMLSESESEMAYWVSFLDGTQRVLLFTSQSHIANEAESTSQLEKVTQEIEVSIHGIGLSIVNNIKHVDILYLGIASSGVIWESKKTSKARFKQMKIAQTSSLEHKYQEYLCAREVGDFDKQYFLEGSKFEIDFDNMMLQKNSLREIRRTFYPGLWLQLKTSPYQTQIHAKINRVQIDNQLLDCIFPVVLAPVAPPKSVAATTALKPFVECSIVQRIIPHSTVKQFKYCRMLIQEFHVKVDILFITELAEIFSNEISDEEAAKLFNQDVENISKPLSELVASHTLQEQKNFYDNLHLGPLKIHVSFSMAGSDTSALPGILSTILQGVGVTLTDINDVVFRLAFFEREYQFFTQRQIISEITSHYVGQAVKQLYVLVLGLDVLGNPYGLVVGLTKGVEDLFYEPFQGAIQGPGEFAEGLVLGVKSLFGHTVGGAAGAVSKITGAMGKGLAALTFDKDYQRKRREALNKKPTNFQEGIARSGKGLVMGVFDGVTGVVMKPISGAKQDGVEGFFKGLGKGAVGLIARPTAGVVDFASGSFEAVKRATETTEDVQRLRAPRFLHSDGVVRPYSNHEAQGNKLLKEIDKGKYAQTDSFSHYEEILDKREILLLSNHRVIYSIKNELFGHWCVQWTYRWNEINMIRASDRGIDITLKKDGKKILGLFSSSEEQKKIILIPQKARRDKLAKIMDNLKQQAAKN